VYRDRIEPVVAGNLFQDRYFKTVRKGAQNLLPPHKPKSGEYAERGDEASDHSLRHWLVKAK
jgi:hypothetical protein